MSWGTANEQGVEPVHSEDAVRPVARQQKPLYARAALFGVGDVGQPERPENDTEPSRVDRTVEYSKNTKLQYKTHQEQLEDERRKHGALQWPKTKEELWADPGYLERFEKLCGAGQPRRREAPRQPSNVASVELIEEKLLKLSLKEKDNSESGILEVYDIEGVHILEAFILETLGIEKEADLDKVHWINENFAYLHFKESALDKVPLCTDVARGEFKTRRWNPAKRATPDPAQTTQQRQRLFTPKIDVFNRLVTRMVTSNNKKKVQPASPLSPLVAEEDRKEVPVPVPAPAAPVST